MARPRIKSCLFYTINKPLPPSRGNIEMGVELLLFFKVYEVIFGIIFGN